MRNEVHVAVLLAVAALPPLSACSTDASPGSPGHGLKLSVAPLSLPAVDFACYDVEVSNGAAVVWSKGAPTRTRLGQDQTQTRAAVINPPNPGAEDVDTLCSDRFGSGAGGDIAYVGPCDASSAENTVTLWVDGIYGSGGTDIADWRDPCPGGCSLSFDCVENQDTLVEFNLVVMRDAQQGFFDVAVNFEDIFCSAKFDCVDPDTGRPIRLVFDPVTGQRVPTAVLAFACTAGAGADTHLYLSDVALTCDGQPPVSLSLSSGNGNMFSVTDPAPAPLVQVGVYQGAEDLDDTNGTSLGKLYSNVALGFDLTSGLASDCALEFTATASDGPLADCSTPTATTYPIVRWALDVTNPAGDAFVCSQYRLDAKPGDDVYTGYTAPAMPESFDTVLTSEPVQNTRLTRAARCACEPGFVKAPTNDSCVACPPGTFDDRAGVCAPCPAGSVQPTAGQTSCSECPANTYDDGSEVCADCDLPKPMLHYTFDGDTVDASGNGRHGVISGPARWVAGASGQALAFDGQTSVTVTAGSSLGPTSTRARTVSFWGDFLATDGGVAISQYRNYLPNDCSFLVGYHRPGGRFSVAGTGTDDLGAIVGSDLSGWHHWVTVLAPGSGATRIYRDGSLLASGTVTYPTVQSPFATVVGELPGSNTLAGVLDEVRIFDRALSPAEVGRLLLCSPRPAPPPETEACVTLTLDGAVFHRDTVDSAIPEAIWVGVGTTSVGIQNSGSRVDDLQIAPLDVGPPLLTDGFDDAAQWFTRSGAIGSATVAGGLGVVTADWGRFERGGSGVPGGEGFVASFSVFWSATTNHFDLVVHRSAASLPSWSDAWIRAAIDLGRYASNQSPPISSFSLEPRDDVVTLLSSTPIAVAPDVGWHALALRVEPGACNP
jgi:hypothetical protein